MTEGKPSARLIEFAIPLLIGNFAQQLYSTVDSIIVGKFVGDNALAAIGASGPLFGIVLVIYIGISVGAGILVSQYYGAKDKKMLSKTIGNTMVINMVFSIVIMILGLFLIKPLMVLLGTPDVILEMAVGYVLILYLGIMGPAYYNILAGLLRGMGDSVMPLVYLIVCTLINIILDIIFVGPFALGVAGAAYATVIAQFISAFLCYRRILKIKDVLIMDKNAYKMDFSLITQLARLGLPAGLSQGIISMAMIFVQKLTNSFGETFIAVSTVVMRVDGFAMLPNFTFGTAITTFVGQNIGAMKIDRVRRGTKDGLKIGLITSAVLVSLILIFGKFLMGLFTNTETVIDFSYRMMCILGIGYIAFAVTQILSGTMRGAGDTMTPMWIALITTLTRVPIAYVMAALTKTAEYPNGDPKSIFISLVTAWVMGAVITTAFYKRGDWAKRARVGGKVIDIRNMH